MLTSPHPLAQFEYQPSEGPNINTFYSSSHQGEQRPHHQSSQSEPEAALKDRVPEKMSQRRRWWWWWWGGGSGYPSRPCPLGR